MSPTFLQNAVSLPKYGMRYHQLLETNRWQRLRRFVYKRDKGRCVICGAPGCDTHHWTYGIGFFNPESVILVCRPCHLIWQGRSPKHLPDDHKMKPNLEKIAEIARMLGRDY